MIRTTMTNSINKGVPSTREHGNIQGKVGSRNVIRTNVSKPGCQSDGFVAHKGSSRPITTTVKGF